MIGGGQGPSAHKGSLLELPDRVRRILPADTADAWLTLAPHLPKELYLGGGTAVAVHLGHRESRDLGFFFHRTVDLSELKALIGGLGTFAVTDESEGTLKGLFEATKVEVFDSSRLKQLAKATSVAGLNVASLQDLMAMKIKVMAERGEMRDYFDVKAIDEEGDDFRRGGRRALHRALRRQPEQRGALTSLRGDGRPERCRSRRVAADRRG